jgi:isopentenyl diphosphate isomerase/L-lactate dehydrogenase-like FMN-dependent dehydrogenase
LELRRCSAGRVPSRSRHSAFPFKVGAIAEPINVWDYERLAEQKLDANALAYFAGGAGDEVTLRDNVAAFERRKLRPRMLVDVSSVTTATTVLGTDVSMPVLIAPLAYQRMAHPDGEAATARAAAGAGTIMCLSSAATHSPSEVAEACAARGARWFQVYVFKDRALTESLIADAVDCGYSALVLTVDVPYLGRRERDVRVGFRLPQELEPYGERLKGFDATLSWKDLEWLAGYGLPVVVKGILTAEDARLACEHGAAAVEVSNHGGRQLDAVPASIDALEEIADAVDGRAEVLLDGGVRRGTDVLKALALGARAVLIGRAMVWALAVDGEAGVTRVLDFFRGEIELGLALLGCRSPAEVTRAHVT